MQGWEMRGIRKQQRQRCSNREGKQKAGREVSEGDWGRGTD